MRTKTLLCLAALTAAGVASSWAQSNVYSLNVVGYINIPVVANQYVMIANQLNTTNNTLAGVIPSPPPGSQWQVFNNGGISAAYAFDDVDGWTPNGSATMAPGLGGYFKSPVATTITFVGEVRQGLLTNDLQKIYAVRSSIVPQQGTITDLVFPSEPGDQIQIFSNGGISGAFAFDDVDGWTPGNPLGPTINVGQAFFVKKASGATQTKWIRNFTVQ